MATELIRVWRGQNANRMSASGNYGDAAFNIYCPRLRLAIGSVGLLVRRKAWITRSKPGLAAER